MSPISPQTLPHLFRTRTASRLWDRDPTVFSVADDQDVRAAILNRLGWLEAPTAMRAHLDEIDTVVAGVQQDGLTEICLLGMGGSSLCAEVLRTTLAAPAVADHVHVLDTTDERAIRHVTETLDPARTLFLVASKSGTTVEVTALEAYFRTWVAKARGADAGRHFIAITDPNTPMVAHATTHGYRHLFINPADIGGRYSALSLFGLVPAALMGIAPARLLDRATVMADACRLDTDENPGLALGAFMASQALSGRDKLTLLLPESVATFGLWVEQLVAESTGKLGTGVLPVVGEPVAEPHAYGHDRAFVLVAAPDDADADVRRQALAAAGHPVFQQHTTPADLGAEFFRWEFATAIAGVVLDVNPFDEPNVKDAKARTMKILDGPRPLVVDPPLVERDGLVGRSYRPESAAASGAHPFIALLDYLPVDADRDAAVARVRARLSERTGLATTHGFGPRYLHSTGQFHKGGTNCGMFLLLTAADGSETPVPDAPYSFSVLKQAQALGDFDALRAAERHVVHYHISDPQADFSAELERILGMVWP